MELYPVSQLNTKKKFQVNFFLTLNDVREAHLTPTLSAEVRKKRWRMWSPTWKRIKIILTMKATRRWTCQLEAGWSKVSANGSFNNGLHVWGCGGVKTVLRICSIYDSPGWMEPLTSYLNTRYRCPQSNGYAQSDIDIAIFSDDFSNMDRVEALTFLLNKAPPTISTSNLWPTMRTTSSTKTTIPSFTKLWQPASKLRNRRI